MDSKFSPRLNEVLSYSREEAIRLGHNAIGPEHFLLGILREGNGSAIMILKALDVDLKALRKIVENSITNNEKSNYTNSTNLELKKQAAKAVKLAHLELMIFKSLKLKQFIYYFLMLKDENSIVTSSLSQFNIDYETVKNEFASMIDLNSEEQNDDINTNFSSKPKSEISDSDSDDEELFSNKPKRSRET